MAKTKRRHAHKRVHHLKSKPNEDTMIVVQGWMFVVAFALMLGIGAVVGTYFNRVINSEVPTVAGAQVEVR